MARALAQLHVALDYGLERPIPGSGVSPRRISGWQGVDDYHTW